jgi:hypothetical protein
VVFAGRNPNPFSAKSRGFCGLIPAQPFLPARHARFAGVEKGLGLYFRYFLSIFQYSAYC